MMDRIAVLIPCWNEALTIEKVVSDFKRVLPEAVIYMIIIPPTAPQTWRLGQAPWYAMNTGRERGM